MHTHRWTIDLDRGQPTLSAGCKCGARRTFPGSTAIRLNLCPCTDCLHGVGHVAYGVAS